MTARRRSLAWLAVSPLLLFLGSAFGQAPPMPFSIQVQEVPEIGREGIPKLHSYAHAQVDDYWVLVAGRTDAIHAPFAATECGGAAKKRGFCIEFANRSLWIVQLRPPKGNAARDVPAAWERPRVWQLELPEEHAFALSVSNPQAHYDSRSGLLYVIGGYGQTNERSDPEIRDITTFGGITAIAARDLVSKVVATQPDGGTVKDRGVLESIVAWHRDCAETPSGDQDCDVLRVTGGELLPLGELYFLVFGHDCRGAYCMMKQVYTRQIRPLEIGPGGKVVAHPPLDTTTTAVAPPGCTEAAEPNLGEIVRRHAGPAIPIVQADPSNEFRRRDGNAAPFLRRDGAGTRQGFAAYGGVFQQITPRSPGAYLKPIYVELRGRDLRPPVAEYRIDDFLQHMNQYSTALLPIYDPEAGTMYTAFFGGLSQYEYDPKKDEFACNLATPYVKDVSVLIRPDGATGETSREVVLPGLLGDYLGTEAKFFWSDWGRRNVSPNEVLLLSALREDGEEPVVGYVYGGILCTGNCRHLNQEAKANREPTNRILEVRLKSTSKPGAQ